MNVLTVFAHPSPRSFCHSVLERFADGLRDAGHTNEVVDLYAIGFDPVLRERDNPNWMDEHAPQEVLDGMHLRERMLGDARGPLKRFAMRRLDDLGFDAALMYMHPGHRCVRVELGRERREARQ